MRILILTQWYPPEPQKLQSDLAQTLQSLGHDVTVLTGFPNWPSGKLFPGYRLKHWQRENLDGVSLIRVPLYPDHSRSVFKRILNYVSFAASAALLGPWLAPRPDVIHVVHPPVAVGVAGWLISCLWRVPFTFEIQDMWPETLRATGMVNSEHALSLVGWFAKWVYNRAAAIRVISPGFRDNLLSKGVPPEKVHVISNWVDTDFYKPMKPDPELALKLGLTGRFNIMYAGTIGLAQKLDTVLDTACLLQDLPDIQFVLVGDGIELPRLQETARARELHNVRFLGRYPGDAMPGFYALADVLLVHLRDDPLFRITIPHKTMTYLASGKPMLAAMEGDVADMVRSAQAGLTCPPDNPEALADAVRRFHSMPHQQMVEIGQNGRHAACELYSRQHLVEEIARMLKSVVT